jgi:hypothetical protein
MVMKPKTKVLVLLLSLILPYMGLVMYRVFAHPEHPFPRWFLYAAPCYFLVTVTLFAVLRKRILLAAPPIGLAEQNTQRLSAARAVRRVGYIWLLGPVFVFISGGFKDEPFWAVALDLSWVGFLSWATFRDARKLELRARQNPT